MNAARTRRQSLPTNSIVRLPNRRSADAPPSSRPSLLTAAQRALSSLDPQPGLCKEGTDQMGFLSQSPDREGKLLVQLLQVAADDVAHLDILQVIPPALVPGVQVGRIARQGLQPHPAARARHELLDLH